MTLRGAKLGFAVKKQIPITNRSIGANRLGELMKSLGLGIYWILIAAVLPAAASSVEYRAEVFAGKPAGARWRDGSLSEAVFRAISDVAIDKNDNIYAAEWGFAIRKISSDGIVSTLAGHSEERGYADGPGPDARFETIRGVAVDDAGIVYVADAGNHVIRRIDGEGVVSTFAGQPGVSGLADGAGNQALFNNPVSVEVDADGILYVADQGNNRVRKITSDGLVTTLAGIGTPEGLAIDGEGNVYVGTWGTQDHEDIYVIHPDGTAEKFAGLIGRIGRGDEISYDGPIDLSIFNDPTGLAIDGEGKLFVSDTVSNTIRRIDPVEGMVTTVAGLRDVSGSQDGLGSEARFNMPVGMAFDGSGNLVVADRSNRTLRKISPAGEVTTIAGVAPGNEDGPAEIARFDRPYGIDVDAGGRVLVVEYYNHTLRSVDGGVVSTVAGKAGFADYVDGIGDAARFSYPYDVAVADDGTAYVVDGSRIRSVSTNGEVATLAGNSSSGTSDGLGPDARFSRPWGITMGTDGFLYVADSSNQLIRKVSRNGDVSTLAGIAKEIGSVDGPALESTFNYPRDLVQDANGNLFITDRQNNTIRKLSNDGAVSTLAGKAGEADTVDGIGEEARFNSPIGIAINADGNLLVSEFYGNIRRVSPDGEVKTVSVEDADGEPVTFLGLANIGIGGDGTVYFTDASDNTIYSAVMSGTEMPTLRIARIQNGVLLSWPSAHSEFVLESGVQSGSSFEWRQVVGEFSSDGDMFWTEIEFERDLELFQLRGP